MADAKGPVSAGSRAWIAAICATVVALAALAVVWSIAQNQVGPMRASVPFAGGEFVLELSAETSADEVLRTFLDVLDQPADDAPTLARQRYVLEVLHARGFVREGDDRLADVLVRLDAHDTVASRVRAVLHELKGPFESTLVLADAREHFVNDAIYVLGPEHAIAKRLMQDSLIRSDIFQPPGFEVALALGPGLADFTIRVCRESAFRTLVEGMVLVEAPAGTSAMVGHLFVGFDACTTPETVYLGTAEWERLGFDAATPEVVGAWFNPVQIGTVHLAHLYANRGPLP
ncbi:MAG: hypothetical protein EA356_10890 [Geminicoccaceae bacterium]|nr:MAG: hypothetical protein EA356_10890 [Geminicoccaceae bacterium]